MIDVVFTNQAVIYPTELLGDPTDKVWEYGVFVY
jgi:hypothetical protein